MDFQVTEGISEQQLADWLHRAAAENGTFSDGRVDYSRAGIAPIVMCTVTCGQEILLVKRGYGLADAEGYWSTITGFIDAVKPVAEQARQELREELGLDIPIGQIAVAPSYTLKNQHNRRTYIVFPCHTAVDRKPAIQLDQEHTEYVWSTRARILDFHIMADLPYSIDAALSGVSKSGF
jgi:ADP-ribose pyrophosphatase YjhB (NUDIX family)